MRPIQYDENAHAERVRILRHRASSELVREYRGRERPSDLTLWFVMVGVPLVAAAVWFLV